MTTQSSRAWRVVAAGTGINLALGVLYAWSVIKGAIPDDWHWTNADKALPYSVACLVFALMMIPAGKMQDRFGPRIVASIGGVLTGLGFILASLSGSSLLGFVCGFGVLAGAGIGFGYAAATPAAVKWFPAQKTGLITGIVVAGFGLASVYIAPLATYLLARQGIATTLLVMGISFLILVLVFAQFLRNPDSSSAGPLAVSQNNRANEKNWREVIRESQFIVLWLMYFAGSAAGLTFISVAQGLGKKSLGEYAFFAVVALSIGNAGGRILAGIISDRLGRQKTLLGAFMLQVITLASLYVNLDGSHAAVILVILFLLGGNYGANLALFPSAAKDYFGLKNFGLNYGLLFSAWGAAGLIMPWLNGYLQDRTGSAGLSYIIICVMLAGAAALTFVSSRLARR